MERGSSSGSAQHDLLIQTAKHLYAGGELVTGQSCTWLVSSSTVARLAHLDSGSSIYDFSLELPLDTP
ncbi:hypothetical protein CYMTET_10162, partial [Cymbomonas tetramitiformis]